MDAKEFWDAKDWGAKDFDGLLPAGHPCRGSSSKQKYAVPETGANVDLPITIFSKDAGQPESGYGRRFLTSDGRANLTVQSVPNKANDSPAAFLAKMRPPSEIVYRRVTPNFFVVSRLPTAVTLLAAS